MIDPQHPSSPRTGSERRRSGAARFSVSDRLRRTGDAVQGLLVELRGPPRPAPAAPQPPPRGAGLLRVASYNIHKCVGIDRRFEPARTAAVIAELGADLVAVQEADRRFGRRTGLLDLVALERETGLAPLPVSDLADGHGWHGNALLVRPGTPARIRRLTLPGAEPRGALVADLDLPSGRLRVVAAHLGLLRRSRAQQAAAILRALAETPEGEEPLPTLLLGDLNEWRPGHRSSLRAFEPFFGPVTQGPPSFPTRLPVLALDRILGWPRGLVSHVAAHDSALARIASDHLPLTATVRLGAVAEQEEAAA
jgi:endonuclease/exonuclease/phosphatase family metal-dependent hydrolase